MNVRKSITEDIMKNQEISLHNGNIKGLIDIGEAFLFSLHGKGKK